MFSLLMLVTCSGLTYPAQGQFLCNGTLSKVAVHVSNSGKGQVILMDKDSNNVFDYGNIYKEKGFWFFKRKVVEYKSIALDTNLQSNNPLYIGVSNIENPTVYGRVEQVDIKNPVDVLGVQCGKELLKVGQGGELRGWLGQGILVCKALENSTIVLKFSILNKTELSIVSTDCQLEEQKFSFEKSQNFDWSFSVQNRTCNYYISQQTKESAKRAIITVEGSSRTEIRITEPMWFDKKIFKPVLATSLEVEQYIGSKVTRREATKNDLIDVGWFNEGTLCAFAYSSVGQITTSCFNTEGIELAPFFR